MKNCTLRWAHCYGKRLKLNALVRYEEERALMLTKAEKQNCLHSALYLTGKEIMYLTSNIKLFTSEENGELRTCAQLPHAEHFVMATVQVLWQNDIEGI